MWGKLWDRTLTRLSALGVKSAVKPGRYGDGDGLYLVVSPSGSKSWIVRVQKDGKRRDIGLGGASKVPLKLARERAAQVRMQIEVGVDPIAERKREAGIPSFREATKQVHAEHKRGWKNGKHQAQWLSTLERYAFPAFGDQSVAEVEASQVRDALAQIWLVKPETARRLRQRIITVIDWAVAKGYRERGLALAVIDKSLPKQRKRVEHHAALPYADVPRFIAGLRERESVGRLALDAVILTAARSGEIRLAVWEELDLEQGLWTIPAKRMKSDREHVVPLSPEAVQVFRKMKSYRRLNCNLVFPGTGQGKPLSDMTLTKILRDMGLRETVHGFRSTFRDWAAEKTTFRSEVAEAALAHVNPDKTEAAYFRSDLRTQRRQLMKKWGTFCSSIWANRN